MDNRRMWSEELEKECREYAEAVGLYFVVCAGTVTTFQGWKSEQREATDEEIVLWGMAGGPT